MPPDFKNRTKLTSKFLQEILEYTGPLKVAFCNSNMEMQASLKVIYTS